MKFFFVDDVVFPFDSSLPDRSRDAWRAVVCIFCMRHAYFFCYHKPKQINGIIVHCFLHYYSIIFGGERQNGSNRYLTNGFIKHSPYKSYKTLMNYQQQTTNKTTKNTIL